NDTVYFKGLLERLADSMGCQPSQKAVAQQLGISEQDFSNRKGRGTLAEPIVDWCLKHGSSLDYMFGLESSDNNLPDWLRPHIKVLESLSEFDQGRAIGALQLLGLIKLPEKSDQ
ncbi:helix-turn-helix domain containing protein, partial [Patescibacteria group bacterium]|nr:helix-turn-helix domain containing protein [Patescibacteria group bacterium]